MIMNHVMVEKTHVWSHSSHRWYVSTIESQYATLALVNIDRSPPHSGKLLALRLAELAIVISRCLY